MRNSIIKLSCGVVAALVLSVAQGSALIIAWDTAGHGTPGDVTLTASTIDANLATGDGFNYLSRVGISSTGAGNSFNSKGWNPGAFNQNDKYFTFTIKAVDDFELNLTDLRAAMNGSNTGPRNGRWGYSLDGGTTFTMSSDYTIPYAAPGSLNVVWDFDDFTTTNAVVFRYWGWGPISIAGGATNASAGTERIDAISGDDLIVNGTITQVIPEPSTICLIGLGLLGLVAFARRRHA